MGLKPPPFRGTIEFECTFKEFQVVRLQLKPHADEGLQREVLSVFLYPAAPYNLLETPLR